MTLFYTLILFFAAFIPGLVIIFYKKPLHINLNNLLIFAGAYIFSITIVHLLPELLANTDHPGEIAIFVLLGYIMQTLIDYMTSGVEHGHRHTGHLSISPFVLLIGLSLHSIMDGSILVQPGNGIVSGNHWHSMGLLVGIVLHKIPAAIVLMSVLQVKVKNFAVLMIMLLIFSITSPAGYLFSDYLNESHLLGKEGFLILFAMVSGNFLHISTSIYFESSPDHAFNRKKFIISGIGVLLAVLVEVIHH